MDKVGIIINRRKPGATVLAKKIKVWLKKQGKTVFQGSRENVKEIIEKSDLLVCLGGDGTILHVAGNMAKKSIPVVGVNLGGLGFLTGVKGQEVFKELASIFRGSCKIEERILIQARIGALQEAGGDRIFQGLNDVVINREGLTRYLKIRVKAGGEDLMSFWGDGVIVATPTGSTAYSLSAGGPFVYPTLDSFVVTPLCAHALLTRPIVLPTDKKISVTLQGEKGSGRASFTMDGQIKRVISPENRIEISKAPLHFKLIGSSQRSYLATLREKFGMMHHG